MKTSIRLALTSLLVCGITFAASGAPLPFLPKHQTVSATLDAPLPLAGAGADPGLEIALAMSRRQ
ncbi:MAG: hypothetical protein ABL956_08240 [Hyphomonadaceae bacterium]